MTRKQGNDKFSFSDPAKMKCRPCSKSGLLGEDFTYPTMCCVVWRAAVNNRSGPTRLGSADYAALVTGYLAWDLFCVVSVKPDGNEISPL